MKHIAILDCAIKQASFVCFNRLVQHIDIPFTYHRPSVEGLSSLHHDKNADGYIIFGSASNVEERLDWHKELADFCLERLQNKQPVLGLCFGHQLMADAFGLEVIKNPGEKSYYGTREVTFNQNWGSYRKGDKKTLFVAHSYQVSGCNDQLITLANSEVCPQDALIHKELPYLGFQPHPEASEYFVTQEILEHEHNLKIDHKNDNNFQKALVDGLNIVRTFCESALKDQ